MLLHDRIDFEPKEIYKQKGPTCAVHSFFVLVSEMVQQKYGIDVEFDMYKYFETMEKERVKLTGKKRNRMDWLCWEGLKGFKTKDGRTVKITRFRRLPVRRHDTIAKYLQMKGPLYLAVRTYKELDMTPSGYENVIGSWKDDYTKKGAHAIVIRGNDRVGKMYKLHDSKGGGEANSVNWLPYDVFEKIAYKVISIYDVILEQ